MLFRSLWGCKADGSLCQVAGGLLQYAPLKPFSTFEPKKLLADLKSSGPELSFGILDIRLPSMCRDGPILGLGPGTNATVIARQVIPKVIHPVDHSYFERLFIVL